MPEAPQARFHAVRSGQCWLRVGQDEPISITEGELILLPRGDQHDVLSDPDSDFLDVTHAFGDADSYQRVFRMGVGDQQASLICGGFVFDDADLHPLPTCLPRVMRLRDADLPGAGLRGLLDLVHSELQGPYLASEVVLRRLSEILFITAVRVFAIAEHENGTNWLSGLADPVIGEALAVIHSEANHNWSVSELARKVGTSKTTLTGRFKDYVGYSPHRYLTRWRMIEARRLLREGAMTVAEISECVGYASEAAFSRAFHREVGIPPSECRPNFISRSK
jgi:AraC-like DNA-binding protein